MNYNADSTHLSALGRGLLDRRNFLGQTAGLMGSFSLLHLLGDDSLLASSSSKGKGPFRPTIDSSDPYAARNPMFPVKAKKLLIISCPGAVSHIDTFDYKPDLERFHGKKPPGLPAVTFSGPTGNVAMSPWKFRPRGQSGKMISDLLPNLAEMADDMCFLHSLTTQTSAHPQAENLLNTGSTFEGFPSLGAWTSYALGSENESLPAFVAIEDPRGKPRSGKNDWGSGFLPAAFQGTDFNASNPPANLKASGFRPGGEKRASSLLSRLNDQYLTRYPGDADLAARIASYELAGKMQMSIPEVTQIDKEPAYIHQQYGTDSGSETKRAYAKNCILARRLLEQGVRVVQLFNGSDASGGNGITNWDSHNDLEKTHGMQAEIMDQPTAALLQDMKQRGMLEDTLVVWCTEFGRMPFLQENGTGRDHNPGAFTAWFMGAGVNAGTSYGASDEFGFKVAENPLTLYDFNATILRLMGFDHEKLTYYHNGLERRLTVVHGHVIEDVLA
ncbi:MAG: DUF1501 domain-containing protein [Verrucomicrobiales bacterium]|nr:DUF1501 domain-containing protein [Verrucomicrobiales bacterium]